jgi:transcription antitermination factor NusG
MHQLLWYGIRVRSKCEKLVSATLEGKGYEAFLPLYRAGRVWSDRSKELDLPLFPGYTFCRLDVQSRLMPVFTTPGVISIVGAGRTPVPISTSELDTVRAVIKSGLLALPWPSLIAGTRVFIERGPLAGVEGMILKTDKRWRLLVSISLLQRAVSVEIDREWVRPIIHRVPNNQSSLRLRDGMEGEGA